jgi:phosphate/phosphite/phosphonate ABC transporter binding protein
MAATDPLAAIAPAAAPRSAWVPIAAMAGGILLCATLVIVLVKPWARTTPGPAGGAAGGAPAPAFAPGVQPLRYGTVRYLPADTMRKDSTPIADYLSGRLGEPVEELMLEDYEQVQGKLLAGKVDIVTVNPLTYVRIKDRMRDLDPLAVTVADGATIYQGVIVTKMSSGLQTLESLRGKVMCWVSPTSASGYLFPRALLRRHKLDPETMFKSTVITGDHISALRAVRDGDGDAAAVFATALFNARDLDVSPGAFQVIGTTDSIPLDVIVARPDLPAERRARIRKALLDASPGSEPARQLRNTFSKIDGFAPARDADYDGVRQADKAERATRDSK